MTASNSKNQESITKSCWNTIGVWSRGDKRCDKLEEYIHCRNCPVFSETGRNVFEKKAPSQYLTHWRKKISSKGEEDERKENSVLMFRLCTEWFAMPTGALSEIAKDRVMHRIPRNRNQFVSGIVNINGEIKTCYSFAKLLDIDTTNVADEKGNDRSLKRLIVVTLDGLDYVFAVDEVVGVGWYGDEDLASAPKTLEADKLILILGVIKQDKKQVAIFNMQKLQEKLEELVA